jgi:riboflavin biosynthesis pyrimidine reductase
MSLDRADLLERYGVPDRATQRVRANFIASLDGAATHDGRTGGLNDAADKAVFDLLRMLSDVVLVGAGTLRIEGYRDLRIDADDVAWRTEHGLPGQPTLAVVSGRLDLSAAMDAFSRAPVRPIVFTVRTSSPQKQREMGAVADVVACGEHALDVPAMLEALRVRGLSQVLCEGGPHLLGTLVAADRVDELCLTLSPVLENGAAGRIIAGAAQTPRPMRLMGVVDAGDTLMLRYARARPGHGATGMDKEAT